MAKFETLETFAFDPNHLHLKTYNMPELVHMEDPAFTVMRDYCHTKPPTVDAHENIDAALNEMKYLGVHVLLVLEDKTRLVGVVSTEDILGEKPIRFVNERRIERSKIMVRAIMTPIEEVPAFDLDTVKYAKVGNIVNSLIHLKQHYALVLQKENDEDYRICGLFNTWQISKQLHHYIANSFL